MKHPFYLLLFHIFLRAKSDNIIDVDDILSESFMPSNLLMLENRENGNFPNTTAYGANFRKRALTGSLHEAISTMEFHRSKMNEYLCRNFVAEQIVVEMSTPRIRKRLGTSEESSKNNIKESMMHDEGSKNYENWLQKSTTLEDIYRHYETDPKKRNDRHGEDKEEEDEEYDSHVIEYTYQPSSKPSLHDLYSVYGTSDHNQGHGYVGHDFAHEGLNSYVGLHPNNDVYGGLYDNFHLPATYGSGNRGLNSIGTFETYSSSKYHNSGNKEKDLTDLLEIASTALAYLSFGMFIIHVVMCVSSISNNSTTVVTMMPMSMSPSAPEPTAGGMTSAGMTGNGGMTMTGTGGGGMTMTGTGGGSMTMTGTGDGTMTMTGMGDNGMNGGGMTGGTGGSDTMPGTDQGTDMTDTGAAGTMPDTGQGGDMTSTGGDNTMPGTNQGTDMTDTGAADTMPGTDQGGDTTSTGGDATMPGTSQGNDMTMPDQGGDMTMPDQGGDMTGTGNGGDQGGDTTGTGSDQGGDTTSTGDGTGTTSDGDSMTGTGDDGSNDNGMTGTGVDGGSDMTSTGADGTDGTGTGDGSDVTGSTDGDAGDGMTGDGGVDSDGGVSDDGDSMTGTGRSMTGAGMGIDIPQTSDGSMSNKPEGGHINPKGAFYGMTAAEMLQETGAQDNLNFRFKRNAESPTTNYNYNLNELARRILISIEAALIADNDNGTCLKKALCENNKYSRTVKSRSKIWIPVWSLGMSWLSGKVVHNIPPATSMLDSLKASILGLGNANCEIIYQDCNLHEERRRRRK